MNDPLVELLEEVLVGGLWKRAAGAADAPTVMDIAKQQAEAVRNQYAFLGAAPAQKEEPTFVDRIHEARRGAKP